jgi:aspartate kinase
MDPPDSQAVPVSHVFKRCFVSVVVQKFGGTSVADAEKIRRAAARAVEAKRAGNQVVMVVSARGKKTDELVHLASEISAKPRPREMDMLLSTGEQESVALMAMAVHELGEEAISLTGAQIGVLTDTTHTRARIVSISTQRMREALDAGQIVIAAGFQGVDERANITTLGRGGSDTTAAALAAVLNADVCEIYTDVEGVFTTDPRVVSDARKIEQVSYDEMLELASLGAGVMHSRSIEFAKKFGVHLRVKPSYSDGPGTLIAPEPANPAPVVTGVAFVRNEARIGLIGIPDEPGIMSQIFSLLADARISVDMVVQNVGIAGSANISFTVAEGDLEDALKVAEKAVDSLASGRVEHVSDLSKVSVVGHGMQTHTGVAAQMFSVLAESGINIRLVTTSEIKISVLIGRDHCEQAVNAIHRGFNLHADQAVAPGFGHKAVRKTTSEVHRDTAALEEDIVARLEGMEDIVVSDVYADTGQARITINQLPDERGIAAKVFSAVAEGGVMVDMIVQNAARQGVANISFTVPTGEVEQTNQVLAEVLKAWPNSKVSCDREIGKLSVVGIGLMSHTAVGFKLFKTLAEHAINVQMVNTSEIKVSVVISPEHIDTALRELRTEFGIARNS